jgi:hypothetical protein
MKKVNHVIDGKNYYGWEKLDETRQNKFNEALFKFGWIDGFWSWEYDGRKRLNHSTPLVNHHHHLHLKYYYKNLNNNSTEYEN